MLNRLLLTSAVALTLAAPVLAQTTVAPTTPAVTSNATQVDGNKLIGQSVQNQADNKTVGSVDSVIIGQDGRIQTVVLSVGGFLGIGKKDVAVDWNQIHVSDNGRKVTMNADKDQLKAMPDYVWPQEHARGSVWTQADRNQPAPATTSSGSSGLTTVPATGNSTNR